MFAEIECDNWLSLAIRIFGVEYFISFVDESESGFGLVLLEGLDTEDVIFSIWKNGKFDVSACLTAEPPFPSWSKNEQIRWYKRNVVGNSGNQAFPEMPRVFTIAKARENYSWIA